MILTMELRSITYIIFFLIQLINVSTRPHHEVGYNEFDTQDDNNPWCWERNDRCGGYQHQQAANRIDMNQITVKGPELHIFLKGLLRTSLEKTVLSVNNAVTDLEKQSSALTTIDNENFKSVFENLLDSYDAAFREILNNFFKDINDPSASNLINRFFNVIYSLHYSLREMIVISATFSSSSLTFEKIQKIEHAALKIGFSIINLAKVFLEFTNSASSNEVPNIQSVIATVYVKLSGLLQFAFDILVNVNTALNNLNGQRSDVISNVQSMINELFLSLINSLSALPDRLNNSVSEFTKFADNVQTAFRKSITIFSDKLKNLITAVENKFGLVLDYFKSFKNQLTYLMAQFSTITLDNAPRIFPNIKHLVSDNFATLNFPMFVINQVMPNELKTIAEEMNKAIDNFEAQIILFLQSITPPISQSSNPQITKLALSMSDKYEIFMASIFKFQIATASYSTENVSEIIASIGLIFEAYADIYYKLSITANNLINLYTGTKNDILSAMAQIKLYADLAAAANDITKLMPELFTATTETAPVILESINKGAADAFRIILSTTTTTASQMSKSILPLMSPVNDDVQAVKLATRKLLETAISVTGKAFGTAEVGLIEVSAQNLALAVQSLSAAISKIMAATASNTNNVNDIATGAIVKEIFVTVLQVVFFTVSNIERYVDAATDTTSNALLTVAKAFLSAFTDLSNPVSDIKNLSGGSDVLKKFNNQLTSTLNNSIGALSDKLSPIMKHDQPKPTSTSVKKECSVLPFLDISFATGKSHVDNELMEAFEDGCIDVI